MEEGIGFVDIWASFVKRESLFFSDELHLSGKRATKSIEIILLFCHPGSHAVWSVALDDNLVKSC